MQLKRILAFLLAAALIFSVPVVPAGAESTETFEVGVVAETTTPVSFSPVIYNAGEEVSVTVSADQNTGIQLLRFVLYYNTEALELLDYSANNLFKNENLNLGENYVLYNTIMNKASDATGVIFTLNFRVKETFCGDVELKAELLYEDDCKANLDTVGANVPFVGGSDSFTVHTIDAEAGVVTDPTCTEDGYTTYHCSLCDEDVIGNIVPENGHTEAEAVVENRVEPTCLENGSYDSVIYCSVCDAELSRVEMSIDALGHDLLHTEALAPNCTEIGWDAYDTCQREGCDYTTYVEIPATGHFEAEAVVENRIEPDCTNNGSYDSVVYCSVCGVELSREEISIPALGHDLLHTESLDPNCTEFGWVAYDTCQREGCDYTTYEEIPATGHFEAEAVVENRVEPDCVNDGSYDSVVYCSVCGVELSRETIAIPALGHDLLHTDAQAPTCLEIGWDAYDTCQREGCGYTTYVEIPALGHDLQHTDAQAPTCLEIGWEAYDTCLREGCGYTTYVEIPATGHSEAEAVVENRVEPDCVNNGSYDSVVYCSVCGDELSRVSVAIDALGHDLLHTDAQAANCLEIGWDAYDTCQREGCDYTTYVEIPALGHDLLHTEAKDPTCLDFGWGAYDTCQREGCPFNTYVEIPAAGHVEAEAVVENRIEPDCVNDGSYDSVVYCSVCGDELSRVTIAIDALGHDLLHTDAQEATCLEIGWDAYDTCQREGCDYTTYVEIPALGHDLLHTDAQAATCTEIGWDAYDTCQREGCDYTTYVEIPATGHFEAEAVVENRIEPDCTTAGSYDSVVYCSVCHVELSRVNNVIDALGHDLLHTDALAATCTEIGWDAYDTCQREGCGYTTYVEIPATGHFYGDVTVIEPEYKVEGYSTHTCTVCQYEEKFDITAALTYILGDVDGNEEITSDDAIRLLYFTLLPDEYPINQEADLNGDGSVDSDDAYYLLYFTLLPDQYPLYK